MALRLSYRQVASTRTSPMPGSYCEEEIADDLEEVDEEENASLSGFDPLPPRMLGLDSQCSVILNRGIEQGYRSNSIDDSSTISGSTTPQTYCQSNSSGKFQLPLSRNSKDKPYEPSSGSSSKKRLQPVNKGMSKVTYFLFTMTTESIIISLMTI